MRRVGEILRDARNAVGMTQERLAEDARVSKTTVQNLESGRVTKTSGRTLDAYARALGMDSWGDVVTSVAGGGSTSHRAGVPILTAIPASWDRDGDVHSSYGHEEANGYLPDDFRSDGDAAMFALMVEGDSMGDDCPSGSMVTCSPTHWRDHGFIDGEVYAIRLVDDGTTLKRVYLIDRGERLELAPDNRSHPRRVIAAGDVATAALVRGVYNIKPLPRITN